MPAPQSRRLLTVATLVLALAAFPLGVGASDDFADVPNSNPFHADIGALAASGVTTGCGGGNFCPSAFVTREQMAAFMNRLGALSVDKVPVVNAAKLMGIPGDQFLRGPVTTQHGGPWVVSATYPSTFVYHYNDKVAIGRASLGLAAAHLYLTAPASFSGVPMSLASVEICYAESVNAMIYTTAVWDARGASPGTLIFDTTDRAVSGLTDCYTVSTSVPIAVAGSLNLWIEAYLSPSGSVGITSVRATWVPLATNGI